MGGTEGGWLWPKWSSGASEWLWHGDGWRPNGFCRYNGFINIGNQPKKGLGVGERVRERERERENENVIEKGSRPII